MHTAFKHSREWNTQLFSSGSRVRKGIDAIGHHCVSLFICLFVLVKSFAKYKLTLRGNLGVSFIMMYHRGIILDFLSLSVSLFCFEMRIFQVSCLFVVQGFLTSSHTRLSF